MTQLERLNLAYNHIENIQPLTHLRHLTDLRLHGNEIVDVRPLATLNRLEILNIENNQIIDLSPLDGLGLTEFIYDAVCLIEATPVEDRIENRSYPSVFQAWRDVANRRDLSQAQRIALQDLYWFCCTPFGLYWRETDQGLGLGGDLTTAVVKREALATENPNLIFLAEIRMRDAFESPFYHTDWEYWIRDEHGDRVPVPRYSAFLMDFTHPDVQDIIVQQAAAVRKCGLYDGIFIDWWNERYPVLRNEWSEPGYRKNEDEQHARDVIIQRIRETVGDDFLIIVNTNRRKPTRAAPFINGLFMETLRDNDSGYTHDGLIEIESTLLWAEETLRQPRLNALHGWELPTQTLDTPDNRRWMRVFTTMGLTLSEV